MDLLAQLWHRVLARQPLPGSATMLASAVLAAVLVLPAPAWALSRHVVTLVHEAAHGLVATLAGRKLSGIRLHSDTSGLTVSRGRARGSGMVATLLAGYPGPALAGLGAAALLAAGHPVALLWSALVLLGLLLLKIRNWFGLWSVLVSGSVVFSVSWWLPPAAQLAFGYLLAWFLLLAAGRPVVELQVRRYRRGRDGSDADQLARLTGVPALLWVGLFAVVALGSLALGGYWLSAPYLD